MMLILPALILARVPIFLGLLGIIAVIIGIIAALAVCWLVAALCGMVLGKLLGMEGSNGGAAGCSGAAVGAVIGLIIVYAVGWRFFPGVYFVYVPVDVFLWYGVGCVGGVLTGKACGLK